MNSRRMSTLVLAALGTFAATAWSAPDSASPTFATATRDLQTVPEPARASVAQSYTSLLIEDVAISFDESSPYAGLKPGAAARISGDAIEAIRAAVGDRFTIATEAGPGVLRVRPAISEIRADQKRKNFMTYSIVGGIKLLVDRAAGRNVVVRSATTGVELLDSVTGEHVAGDVDFNSAAATDDGRAAALPFKALVVKLAERAQRLVANLSTARV